MFAELQTLIMKRLSPGAPACCDGSFYLNKSKLTVLLGTEFFRNVSGKVIIDFGCGEGNEAIEMAQRGAAFVIGVDVREDVLRTARKSAIVAGVQNTCIFVRTAEQKADLIVSLEAFEHFSDPAEILCVMAALLRPRGEVFVSFGPTWYHPLGGHLFSVFPWAHLIFSEKALIAWRSAFRSDGATRFSEVAGGLNQMTIKRFEQLVAASPFEIGSLELVPINKLRIIHNRFTREFTC